jgi:glycerol-3-phosphate cytidylyltransferase
MMKKKYNIGFTCSCFDLLHSGHITMLQEAKSICDYLIVGLQVDPTIDRPEKNKPIQSLMERQIQLNAVKYVDEVIIYHTEDELIELLKSLPIDVRIIGSDYINKYFTGSDLEIDIYYNKREHNWSTTRLKKLILDNSENI